LTPKPILLTSATPYT